jgi:hypothetical protein
MTRAASDCTSEHGKNYFDSRLMSDMAMFRQVSGYSPPVGEPICFRLGKFSGEAQ